MDINANLNEEHKILRQTVRDVVKQYVAPRAYEIDQDREYPEDIFKIFSDKGFFSILFLKTLGGSDLGTLGLAVTVEEVARACASSAQILVLSALTTWPLRITNNENLINKIIPGVINGSLRGAFALTEPNASSDLSTMVTKAKIKDGIYYLSGEKDFVSGSTVADYFISFARNEQGNMSSFFINMPNPGVIFLRRDEGMGIKGIPHCDWSFDNATTPEENLLGNEGEGSNIARISMNAIQPLLAARGLGSAEESLAFSRNYSLERKIYGDTLSELQAIQLYLADMAVNISAARELTYKASAMVDNNQFTTEEDAAYLNIAKVFSAKTAINSADKAMQISGGHGYMEVHPLERIYRDARHLKLYMGTDEVLKIRVAKSLLETGMGIGSSVSRQSTEERTKRELRDNK